MKKRALKKDFIREIINTKNRFLSILLIVALGVAFFSGIRSTEIDMKYSYDEYFDEHNLYDIRVLGTLGLTDDDIEELNKLEDVDVVEAGYYYDVFSNVDGGQDIIRVESAMDNFNTIDVVEGRMPKAASEILLDYDYALSRGYSIGDKVSLSMPEDDEEDDEDESVFVNNTFEVVGFGTSPLYISFLRGSTNVGSGQLDAFGIVSKESFDLDIYTNIDISLNNTKDMQAFSKEYEDYIKENTTYITDNLEDVRCEARYDEVISEADEKIADAEKELNDAKEEAEEKLTEAREKFEDAKEELEDGKTELEDAKKKIADAKKEISDNEKKLEEETVKYEDGVIEYEDGCEQYALGLDKYLEGLEQFNEGKAKVEQGVTEYSEGLAGYNAAKEQLNELYSMREQLQEGIKVYESNNLEVPSELLLQLSSIDQGISTLETELSKAETELSTAQKELAKADEELSSNQVLIVEAKAELDEAKEKLADAKEQLDDGKRQLDEGKQKIADAKIELADADKEIADAEVELEDGQKEYDEAYDEFIEKEQEVNDEIADAEKELADAKSEIDDLEVPTWYVQSRNDISAYAECGDNADRIEAIGKVFPVLFFLVAALISLTTMTRMVEEQRTQIGTLKALGYGKISIAMKYIMYALFATLIGSAIGILIGQKIFPYIIITAYRMMYPHIMNVVIPYNGYYAAYASIIAIVCIEAAAIFSCTNELKSQASELMRPVPPKNGKRILLERVTFIWNRMNFTWKATCRNLFRYKKRFLMTIFGIGGCMALMVVGFGIRDSILDIAIIQYSQLQLYEASIILDTDAKEEKHEELQLALEENSQIDSFTSTYMSAVDVKTDKGNKEIYVVVPNEIETFSDYVVFRDRKSGENYQLDNDGVLITEKFAKEYEYKVGDNIKVTIDETEYSFPISKIVENYMLHYIYVSPDLYEKVTGEVPEYNSIYFKTVTKDSENTKEIGKELLKYDAVISVSYLDTIAAQVDDMLQSLDVVIVVLIVSAGMLAVVVLYNLNNININERKRELASIKVLGFFDNELAAYVYRENIILTLFGVLAGIGLGKILHQFIIVTVEIESCMFGRNVYPMSYLYSTLFTILFSVLVNLLMYFKLKKIDMVESLKSVE